MNINIRIKPSIIILISVITLIIQFYDIVFSAIIGQNNIISLIGGMLSFIPIALSAFYWGSRGGLFASLIFSFFAIVCFVFRPQTDTSLNILLSEVIGYLSIGIIVGILANREKWNMVISEDAEKETEQSEQIKTLERLASTVANDIKQPLNTIKKAIKNLEKCTIGEDMQTHIDSLSKEVDRLNGVAADYIDFAAQKMTHTNRVNVPSILKEVVTQVRPQAERVGVRLAFDTEQIDGFTLGDKIRLRRMFLNLLINGLQASEGGAQVDVRCRHDKGAGNIIIEISDTGVGISNDVLRRIFDPFFTTRKRGSGLGLSITKAIAEEHSGTIVAENRHPSGAKFTIILPVTDKKVD